MTTVTHAGTSAISTPPTTGTRTCTRDLGKFTRYAAAEPAAIPAPIHAACGP